MVIFRHGMHGLFCNFIQKTVSRQVCKCAKLLIELYVALKLIYLCATKLLIIIHALSLLPLLLFHYQVKLGVTPEN